MPQSITTDLLLRVIRIVGTGKQIRDYNPVNLTQAASMVESFSREPAVVAIRLYAGVVEWRKS